VFFFAPVVFIPTAEEISARLDFDTLVVNSASLGVMGSTGSYREPYLRIQAAVAVYDFIYHVHVSLMSSLLQVEHDQLFLLVFHNNPGHSIYSPC
jgi:hypothetical protein